MTDEQFANLRPGDLVRHRHEWSAYIVHDNYGGRVTAVRVADLTNPSEWDVVQPDGSIIAPAALARPRAAVGERLHEAVVTLDVFLSAYEDRGDAELVERDHNDDLLTYGHLRTILSALALQSPPAKVEG